MGNRPEAVDRGGLRTIAIVPSFSAVCRVAALECFVILCGTLMACALSNPPETPSPDLQDNEAAAEGFSAPQPVTIAGYSQDAIEPFLARDGSLLFFNNSNDPAVNTNLYWASKIDDLTFQFRGEIGGVNTTALDAVASMDLGGNFYFVSTRSYDATLATIYSGIYANGSVSNVAIAPGVSAMKRGRVDFDAEISADGNTLYFTEGVFTGGSVPRSSKVLIARRAGGGFARDPDAGKILRTINRTGKLNYAAATSADELEIFWTRFDGKKPAILTASRPDKLKPFGAARKIATITGFAEAPTISPDGRSIYFHMKNPAGTFAIYRVTRP